MTMIFCIQNDDLPVWQFYFEVIQQCYHSLKGHLHLYVDHSLVISSFAKELLAAGGFLPLIKADDHNNLTRTSMITYSQDIMASAALNIHCGTELLAADAIRTAVLEPVAHDEQALQLARKRFRHYQQSGYQNLQHIRWTHG